MRHPIDAAKFTGRAYQRHRDFWEARFAASDGPFALGVRRDTAGARAELRFELSAAAAANLARISAGSGLGRVVVFLASLSRVFGSYFGKRSFVVDTPPLTDGRGNDSDSVPLVLPVLTSATVADLLREVKDVVAQSYTFHDFPARRLLAQPERADTNVLLICRDIHGDDAPTEAYDVVFDLAETLTIVYDTTVVAPDLIDSLVAHVQNVLASFDDTSRRLEEIDILTDSEKTELLAAGSGSARSYPASATLFGLFEMCATSHRDRIAIESPSRVLTYGDLLREARSLSRLLREQHAVGRGSIVAVVCSRRVEWIVALLAVLDAGAAYLPLDPTLPAARLRHLLDETSAAALLLSDGDVDLDYSGPRIRVGRTQAFDGSGAWRHDATSSDLAYVLYTSGSTGEPKGVMVEHCGFVNMIVDQIRVFGVTASDRVLQLASASFDASLSEIFMTLLSGAALVLIDEETIADPRAFTSYVEERAVTVMTVTPLYLSALERHPLPSVRTLITAGDDARVGITRHYARSKRVFNAYGPTEISVCATMYEVDASDARALIPIGTAVANSSVYVVDIYGRLVPRAVSGEILFAGPGVARGYLGRDGAGFIDDPFAPGRRCYRTGDRGRWLPDGHLAFEGRIDDQLKIRGYRIEPAEVEKALLRHPLVREAHVAPVDAGNGHRDLVAWVSTRERIELWPSIAEFFVYDDIVYGSMAGDERRNQSYRAAFARQLAGRTVLEIGPGPEAVLSRMCIEAGARKVYAVELSAATAESARAKVASLGLADRIEIIHGDIVEVGLPEQADVCVSEIVGSIGGSEGAALLINRARRLLSDPRAQIPARSVTKIAGLSLAGHELDFSFPEIAAHYVERIFAEVGAPFDLRLCLKNLPRECLVTTEDVFEDLDFRDDVVLEGQHMIRLRVTRAGTLDGFLVWLHLIVDASHPMEAVDILESTGSWLPVYFPLASPIQGLATGDEIRATIRRRLAANGRNPEFFLDGWWMRGGERMAPVSYDAYHVAPGFRGTPFYDRLFAGGAVPVRPEASAAGLRQFAAALLPGYMVPAHFEVVDRLPMNRSGKVDRKALPQPRWTSADGARPAARDEREAAVLAVWEEVLGRRPLGIHDNFFVVGGDSIRAIQIASRLGERGMLIATRDVLDHPTPAELAQRVRLRTATAPQEAIVGPVPLTPIQSWFFANIRRDAHHFNQAVMLRFDGELDPGGVALAMEAIVTHHDALRSRFATIDGVVQAPIDGTVQATIEPPQPLPAIEMVDLRGTRAGELDATTARLQGSLDLEHGPTVRTVILQMDDGARLLWIIHHLAVDWVSWRVLLADLQTAYSQWSEGEPIRLPPRTESFGRWAQEAHRNAPAFDAERDYWEGVLRAPDAMLPRDADSAADLVGDARIVELQLSTSATASLLGEANRAYNTEVNDLLLTALARALESERGTGCARVLLETHGREAAIADLDVSRTVGWFTSFFPLLLDLGGESEAGAQIKTIKESLRAIPSKGVGFLIVPDLLDAPLPQISFNYLGQFGGDARELSRGWELASESAGPSVSARAERPCELELLASAIDGRLHLTLTYNAARFRHETAARLLGAFRDELLHLVEHCVARPESEPTASDMSYGALTKEEFESLFAD